MLKGWDESCGKYRSQSTIPVLDRLGGVISKHFSVAKLDPIITDWGCIVIESTLLLL